MWMDPVWVGYRTTEYSQLKRTHKDQQVQLFSEWPIQGLNPQLWWCWVWMDPMEMDPRWMVSHVDMTDTTDMTDVLLPK